MKTPLFAFTLSMIMCLGARAELKWEQTAVELHPAPADKQAVGHFKYQNTGKTPVHFKSVHASCGCTTAQTQKEVVQPGDKGEITATFNIGDRTGTQIKTVTVETDEAANQKTLLTLKAVIPPQQLEISPRVVFWKQGDKPDPKQISVKVGKDFTVKHIKVTSSTPNFQTKVEDTGKGEFKIDVTPQDTNKPANSKLTIQAEDSQKEFFANVQIAKAPIAPGAQWRIMNGRIVAPDGSSKPAPAELLNRRAVAPDGSSAPARPTPPSDQTGHADSGDDAETDDEGGDDAH